MTVLWLLVALLLALLLWFTWTANRLDRMHHRIDVARATLDAQLLRRSGAALELASSDSLDPPSRLLLLDAAHHARSTDVDGFETAESELSEALRAVLGRAEDVAELRRDADLVPLMDELAADCAKAELARRLHNDAVVRARALRSRRRVRWFRLAGTAPELATVDLDDGPPTGLVDG